MKERIKRYELDICIACIVIMSLYHFSTIYDFGINRQVWHTIWDISETILLIIACNIVSYKSEGIISLIFGWPLQIYFLFRGIYYASCYLHKFVCEDTVWNLIMIAPFVAGILTILIHEKRRRKRNG
jgi:hypothetical protein